ncbi:putative Zn finger-like uncharacterized protein [Yoonia maricola]|uniref:Putative Zn finger-like uncharacterized protein n=1 Tax=Yoonia maricola TaxID=420999 RepID=A0A2M8W6C4_9RHOB|nr:zinc-ribbon domain-containing protein [Yoonia maricola]PJI86442.1 putative Zn finger-like uncharacterized protein [Yoonia maricola]
MRLICPNCDAQYEVSDDAIPPGGRDVQCSNCQQSWFQTEKPTVPGREQATVAAASEPSEPVEETEAPDAAADDEVAAETPAEVDVEEAKPAPAPQRKPLDDAVANILREEAALGTAAATTSAIAKPPSTEAAKPAAPVTADETRQRIAQMTVDEGGTSKGGKAPPNTAAEDSADAAHLRTVPSINEINATLRARAQANDTSGLTEAEKEEAVQRKGFRRGFFFILIVLAILILPYIFADQITENLPQTTDIMASYVITVDKLRLALNEMISGLTSG